MATAHEALVGGVVVGAGAAIATVRVYAELAAVVEGDRVALVDVRALFGVGCRGDVAVGTGADVARGEVDAELAAEAVLG